MGPRGARYYDRNYRTRTAKGTPACAAAFAYVTGQPRVGQASDYLSVLSRPDSGYRKLRSGEELQLDDVAVWRHFGSKKSSNGYKYGHIGHIAMDKNGNPILVSLLNAIRGRTTRIIPGAQFFRRVK